MHQSIIVHGPPGCGKTFNAVTIARHRAIERALVGTVHTPRPAQGLAGIITKEQGNR